MRSVLIIEDDRNLFDTLARDLGRRGWDAVRAASGPEALQLMESREFEVAVADVHLVGAMTGLELCRRFAQSFPDVPVVVITGFGSLDTAIEAIRSGAYDFLAKPFETEALEIALVRAAERHSLRAEVRRLRRAVRETPRFEELVGESPAMKRLFDLVDRVAESQASVLISGESGTGKEIVARAIHRRGARAEKPFVAVNCAEVPEPMLEAELFGQRAGAGAERRGVFLAAEGGTLFLDEIAELPPALQPRVLRVLQERKVRPAGTDVEMPVDVRLVAATNRDLDAMVEEKRFREDLFFRVNVIRVEIPPVRARGGDVLLLAQHYLALYAAQTGRPVRGLAPGAAVKLMAYPWPGNVRELQNAVERAVALARFDQITEDDLPERIREHRASHVVLASADPSELAPMEVVERRYVERVVEAVAGNRTLAARILGFDRKTLYRKLMAFRMADEKGGETKAEGE